MCWPGHLLPGVFPQTAALDSTVCSAMLCSAMISSSLLLLLLDLARPAAEKVRGRDRPDLQCVVLCAEYKVL